MTPRYVPSNVPWTRVAPIVRELIDRCGSPEKAALYADIGMSTMYRLQRHHNATVRRDTAQRLVAALLRRRREDRNGRATSQRMVAKAQRAAKIEERGL